MKTLCKKSLPWVVAAIWMGVIFLMSAQTADQSGGASEVLTRWIIHWFYRDFDGFSPEKQAAILSVWHTIIRKGAHFTEYAVLAMLVANALRPYSLPKRVFWLLPVAVSAVYAVSDEIHQYFVPGRACRLLDMGIDTCGAIFGVCVFAVVVALSRKRK